MYCITVHNSIKALTSQLTATMKNVARYLKHYVPRNTPNDPIKYPKVENYITSRYS
jgi:hypothetical protein